MFTGLSTFPLTPLTNDRVNGEAFTEIIRRLATSHVDSITVLGSTGSFAYLSPEERTHVINLAVKNADTTPVFVGVGALRTSHVLENISSAEEANAQAVMLTPMTYQPLTEPEVYELFKTAANHSNLPLIVYENPSTTQFKFSLELYKQIGHLPNIASVKIPSLPNDLNQAQAIVSGIRKSIPEHVTIGISGDASAVKGFHAGCDAWYSVIGGTLPKLAVDITRAAQNGEWEQAAAESERLAPLWSLFKEVGGSVRAVAAIAEYLGLAPEASLPLPLKGLPVEQENKLSKVINLLNLGEGLQQKD